MEQLNKFQNIVLNTK